MDRIVIAVGEGDRFRATVRKYVEQFSDGEYHDIVDPTQEDINKLYVKLLKRLGTNKPNVLYIIHVHKKLQLDDLIVKARHINIRLLIFGSKNSIYIGVRKNAHRIFYESEYDIHNNVVRTEIKTENTCYCYNVHTEILSLYELDNLELPRTVKRQNYR